MVSLRAIGPDDSGDPLRDEPLGEDGRCSGAFLAPPPLKTPGPQPRTEPPTFSVTIPAYQCAGTIERAIDSLLGQSVVPEEIIVCDDGSTDDLHAVLSHYGTRITILRQRHRGAASARNLGLFRAKGSFVVVLDPRSAMMPGALEALGSLAAARPDLDILCLNGQDGATRSVAGMTLAERLPRFPVEDQRLGIISHCFVPASAAVRRIRLMKAGGYDESLGEVAEYEVSMRLILSGARAGMLVEPLRLDPSDGTRSAADDLSRLKGEASVLAKAIRREDLSEEERRLAERRADEIAVDLARAEAIEAVTRRHVRARRLCLELLFGKGQALSTRAWAMLATIAPPLAAPTSQRVARRSANGRKR
jgi:hypothetical protein